MINVSNITEEDTGNKIMNLAGLGNSPNTFLTRAENIEKGVGEIGLHDVLARAVWGVRNRNPLKVASVGGIFERNHSRVILR